MNQDRLWVLMARKLAGEITAPEQAELEQLLKSNPDHHFPLQAFSDLWKTDRYKPDENDPAINDAYFDHIERLNSANPPGKRPKLRILPYLFTIIVVITIIYFSMPGDKPALEVEGAISEVATKTGSKTKLTLPDGSLVWLNAKSKITYGEDFNITDREVQLTGEAFFEVKRDSSKPFLIHTANMDLKVLGTTFNVKAYPGEQTSEASLISGSLEVSLTSRNKQKIILRQSEKIVVANDSATSASSASDGNKVEAPLISIKNITHFLQDDSLIVETSWVKNKLAFQDESFTDIALKMERWYGTEIDIRDQRIARLHFTGIFENETIEQALYAMSITEPFVFKKNPDGIQINASARSRTANAVNQKSNKDSDTTTVDTGSVRSINPQSSIPQTKIPQTSERSPKTTQSKNNASQSSNNRDSIKN